MPSSTRGYLSRVGLELDFHMYSSSGLPSLLTCIAMWHACYFDFGRPYPPTLGGGFVCFCRYISACMHSCCGVLTVLRNGGCLFLVNRYSGSSCRSLFRSLSA